MVENLQNWKFLKKRSLKYFLLPGSCLVLPWTIQIHKKTQSNVEAHPKCPWDNSDKYTCYQGNLSFKKCQTDLLKKEIAAHSKSNTNYTIYLFPKTGSDLWQYQISRLLRVCGTQLAWYKPYIPNNRLRFVAIPNLPIVTSMWNAVNWINTDAGNHLAKRRSQMLKTK